MPTDAAPKDRDRPARSALGIHPPRGDALRSAGRSEVRRSIRRARHGRHARLSGRIRAPAIAPNPRSANLAEAKAEKLAAPRSPAVAPVRMMVPCLRAAMCGTTDCAAMMAPRHATRQACSNSSAVVCSNGLIVERMRVVDQHVDAVAHRARSRPVAVRCLRDVASEMAVTAAGLLDPLRQMFRRPVGAGDTDDVVARPGEGLGDIGAETFRHA